VKKVSEVATSWHELIGQQSKTVKTIDPVGFTREIRLTCQDVKSDTFQRDRAGSLSIQDGADAAPSSSKLGMVSRSSKDDAEVSAGHFRSVP